MFTPHDNVRYVITYHYFNLRRRLIYFSSRQVLRTDNYLHLYCHVYTEKNMI